MTTVTHALMERVANDLLKMAKWSKKLVSQEPRRAELHREIDEINQELEELKAIAIQVS
ncbi:MAG: hypothetical protein GY803_24780 [Chloroflexi bacterium]|nr:hypothetical protein [Chloroflexota bacterium]